MRGRRRGGSKGEGRDEVVGGGEEGLEARDEMRQGEEERRVYRGKGGNKGGGSVPRGEGGDKGRQS